MALPTNIADAAAAIRDGELGEVEEIKIGDLVISALTNVDGTNELLITDKPVARGFSMTDAAVKVSRIRTWDIVLGNPDFAIEAGINAAMIGDAGSFSETWRDKKDKLFAMWNNLEIIAIQSHDESIKTMLIESISPYYDVDDNYDAYLASVVLKEIRQIGTGTTGGLIDGAEESVGSL